MLPAFHQHRVAHEVAARSAREQQPIWGSSCSSRARSQSIARPARRRQDSCRLCRHRSRTNRRGSATTFRHSAARGAARGRPRPSARHRAPGSVPGRANRARRRNSRRKGRLFSRYLPTGAGSSDRRPKPPAAFRNRVTPNTAARLRRSSRSPWAWRGGRGARRHG